jgi:hypothetical protein
MAVMNDMNFDEVLQVIENLEWEALKLVVDNFLGKQEPPRARVLIEEMPKAYRMTWFNMLLKTRFLVSVNFGDDSSEYGLKCHQNVSMLRKRYNNNSVA